MLARNMLKISTSREYFREGEYLPITSIPMNCRQSKYILKVKNRELHDPVLTFQLSNDFHVRNLIDDYWPEDQHSHGNAVLLEWVNTTTGRKPNRSAAPSQLPGSG